MDIIFWNSYYILSAFYSRYVIIKRMILNKWDGHPINNCWYLSGNITSPVFFSFPERWILSIFFLLNGKPSVVVCSSVCSMHICTTYVVSKLGACSSALILLSSSVWNFPPNLESYPKELSKKLENFRNYPNFPGTTI